MATKQPSTAALSPASAQAPTATASLAERIRAAGDDAIVAAFRNAHLPKVQSYCTVVCLPERVDEACDAAFQDFVGRVRIGRGSQADARELLLKATRSAAAGHYALEASRADSDCAAMPDLLAASRNGELQGDEQTVRRHLEACVRCAATAERMARAERAFEGVLGERWTQPSLQAHVAPQPAAREPEPQDPPQIKWQPAERPVAPAQAADANPREDPSPVSAPDPAPLGQWFPPGDPIPSGEAPASSLAPPSLAEVIRTGDPDAFAAFRDAHSDQVRSYCTTACRPELIDEAQEAAFVDFLGRLHGTSGRAVELEDMLLKATRSAAAGRCAIERPDGGSQPEATCQAVPELLAAQANGELPADDEKLAAHLDGCPICRATASRLNRAESAFAGVSGWGQHPKTSAAAQSAPAYEEPPPPPAPWVSDEPRAAPAPPAADDEPRLAPARPATVVMRRRTGGLIGATRQRARNIVGRRAR